MNKISTILRASVFVIVAFFAIGCSTDGPAERAGERIDNATERMSEAGDELVEDANDAADEIDDSIDEATR